MDALKGRGLTISAYVPLLVAVGAVAAAAVHADALGADAHSAARAQRALSSPLTLALLASALLWLAPLQQIAYFLDRVGAIRGEIHNLAPYGIDLLPTLPAMLPYWRSVVDNIERIGPFMPVALQPGCKEHMLPLMPAIMPDLEIMLASADTLKPVMLRMAPSMSRILPFARDLLPFAEDIVCVVQVDGWEALNDYMDVIVPRIARIAPHTRAVAPFLPQMLPYLPILMKHIDALVEELDQTVGVLDRMMPLLPLLPACDQAGLLSQPLAFKALPGLLRRSPLSNDVTGRAALSAAGVHTRLAARALAIQSAVAKRYQLYTSASAPQLEDMAEQQEASKSEDAALLREMALPVAVAQ